MKNKKYILTGYRAKGIELYRTPLKTLGYVVAGLGFVSLGVGLIPNGLGFVFYPLGFMLLGFVGIRTYKIEKKIKNKIRFVMWKINNRYL